MLENCVNRDFEEAKLLGRMLGYSLPEILDDIERLGSSELVKLYRREMDGDEDIVW